MITIQESFEYFMDALSRLDDEKLELSDLELSSEIFEELNVGSHSFMHEWTVDRLIEGNLIPKLLRERILKLRESISILMQSKNSIEAYRNDNEWTAIRNEGNAIMHAVKTLPNKG
ncbi:MAG: hypothetical protein IPM77_09710 [Crocinitomicaceae bacterium]|nr:hypothetical protein [Crocinitomicaceae bacterium]